MRDAVVIKPSSLNLFENTTFSKVSTSRGMGKKFVALLMKHYAAHSLMILEFSILNKGRNRSFKCVSKLDIVKA